MFYKIPATSASQVLIIYLLDISGSMSTQMSNGKQRIEVVSDSIENVFHEMVARSTKGTMVAPRYRVAIFAYESTVHDVLGGIKTIDEVIQQGIPEFKKTGSTTDTAAAFLQAERLLKQELPKLDGSPAPLVVHMTDGQYTGNDPSPIAKRIMQMGNPDGNVLIENIFISDDILRQPISDPYTWTGVRAEDLNDDYSRTLMAISSPLPDTYAMQLKEFGYNIAAGMPMMLPAINEEMVSLAFTISAATTTTPVE